MQEEVNSFACIENIKKMFEKLLLQVDWTAFKGSFTMAEIRINLGWLLEYFFPGIKNQVINSACECQL